jgi:hypothetical protein
VEDQKTYQVELTPKAKIYFLEVLEYFYQYSSLVSAERKADALYSLALTLNKLPDRGSIEPTLQGLKREYRFILFKSTSKAAIKNYLFHRQERWCCLHN